MRGQAGAVRGELIRAVEKLRNEALRSGNLTWCGDHVILVGCIRNQLIESGLFADGAARQIERLLDAERQRHPTDPTTAWPTGSWNGHARTLSQSPTSTTLP